MMSCFSGYSIGVVILVSIVFLFCIAALVWLAFYVIRMMRNKK